MRVLLMTSVEKGHLNPVVGVAQRLLRAGHPVGWLTLPEPAEQLRGLGVELLTLEQTEALPPMVTGGLELARLVSDREALRAWIRGLLLDGVEPLVEPVRAAMRAFSPDVVALDGMLYAGVIAARLERIPFVAISSALTLLEPADLDYELIRTVRALADDRRALFARFGMSADFRTCECLSPLLNVIFATEAFVGKDARVPPAGMLAGPSRPIGPRGDEPSFPWERLTSEKPIVYVSFGSQIFWQPELFEMVAAAAAPLDVQLVLSAGDLAQGLAENLPGDILAVPYAPQLGLLARARALVSHGGANSVMEAMAHGVPTAVIPICNDQPVQAHFLTRAGAGLALARDSVSVSQTREALRRLLEDEGPVRRQARRVQSSYAACDGGRAAAERIVEVAAAS